MTKFLAIALACLLTSAEAFSPIFQKSAFKSKNNAFFMPSDCHGVRIARSTRDFSRPAAMEAFSFDVILPCMILIAAIAVTVKNAGQYDEEILPGPVPAPAPAPIPEPAAVVKPIQAPAVVAKLIPPPPPAPAVVVKPVPVPAVVVKPIPAPAPAVVVKPIPAPAPAPAVVVKSIPPPPPAPAVVVKPIPAPAVVLKPIPPPPPVVKPVPATAPAPVVSIPAPATVMDLNKLKKEIASTREGQRLKEERLKASLKKDEGEKEEEEAVMATSDETTFVGTKKKGILKKILRLLKKIIAPWRKWSNIK